MANSLQKNTYLRAVLLAGAIAVVAGCASGPKIRSNADPQANLSAYGTFAFVDPLGTDRAGYSTFISQQLKTAVRRELETRGYRYSQDNPQLLVNFNAKLDSKMRVENVPSMSASVGPVYYGYRGGVYAPWPTYETQVDQYTEGTLNIDVVDGAQKRLVWEGVAVGRVTEKTRENIGPALDTTVRDIFKHFPGKAARAST
jgi:hypothetical protein